MKTEDGLTREELDELFERLLQGEQNSAINVWAVVAIFTALKEAKCSLSSFSCSDVFGIMRQEMEKGDPASIILCGETFTHIICEMCSDEEVLSIIDLLKKLVERIEKERQEGILSPVHFGKEEAQRAMLALI